MIEHLYTALRSPYGVIVETDNVTLLRQKLYALRKQDPALSVLTFKPSPLNPTGELWIIKRKESDGTE